MIAGIPAGELIDVAVECDQLSQADGSRLVEMKVVMKTWDIQPETSFVQLAKGIAREVLFTPIAVQGVPKASGGVKLDG